MYALERNAFLINCFSKKTFSTAALRGMRVRFNGSQKTAEVLQAIPPPHPPKKNVNACCFLFNCVKEKQAIV